MLRESINYSTNVTQIPIYNLLIVPALVGHSASAWSFTYFFQLKKKPQPTHLELVRMALVCLPVVIFMVLAWQAKREDVRINSTLKSEHEDEQTEYMLERRSMDADSLPAYDASGHKVANVFEAPVFTSPKDRTRAPQGQIWTIGSRGYKNIPSETGGERR